VDYQYDTGEKLQVNIVDVAPSEFAIRRRWIILKVLTRTHSPDKDLNFSSQWVRIKCALGKFGPLGCQFWLEVSMPWCAELASRKYFDSRDQGTKSHPVLRCGSFA